MKRIKRITLRSDAEAASFCLLLHACLPGYRMASSSGIPHVFTWLFVVSTVVNLTSITLRRRRHAPGRPESARWRDRVPMSPFLLTACDFAAHMHTYFDISAAFSYGTLLSTFWNDGARLWFYKRGGRVPFRSVLALHGGTGRGGTGYALLA